MDARSEVKNIVFVCLLTVFCVHVQRYVMMYQIWRHC